MSENEKVENKNKAINNVIVMEKGPQIECWGSISEIARIHGFSYHTLIKKKFPFEFGGWSFKKVPFRERSNTPKK